LATLRTKRKQISLRPRRITDTALEDTTDTNGFSDIDSKYENKAEAKADIGDPLVMN